MIDWLSKWVRRMRNEYEQKWTLQWKLDTCVEMRIEEQINIGKDNHDLNCKSYQSSNWKVIGDDEIMQSKRKKKTLDRCQEWALFDTWKKEIKCQKTCEKKTKGNVTLERKLRKLTENLHKNKPEGKWKERKWCWNDYSDRTIRNRMKRWSKVWTRTCQESSDRNACSDLHWCGCGWCGWMYIAKAPAKPEAKVKLLRR